MKEMNLSEVSTKTAVRNMMENTKYNQFQEVAEALGKKKSTFQSALDNDSMRVRDLKAVADLLGYEVKIEQKKEGL
jgi:nitric oxide synthase oxygenase domain/subunit